MKQYLDFGQALFALKSGQRVCRSGWNGKGMWLYLVHPIDWSVEGPNDRSQDRDFELLPWICMKTADDKLVPWLASQTDILADDWIVVG